ncbi:MAG: hypothetical protein K6B17_04250 [Treponema sp.]|nr:hypothetical protein [Treponema sp.]
MKKTFSSFLVAALTVFNFLTISCDVGMGEAVDLEAPVLTVESPSNNAFVPRNFTIKGTAEDNIGCEKIKFDYKYKINGVEYAGSKSCGVSGNNFECNFTFDKDVEVSFEIAALDKNKNGSEYSSASRTYIIDSNDPKVGKVAIRRGSYTARLLPLADFKTEYTGKTALRDNPENKDYFQNQNFVLYCTLKDSYGIGGAKIRLYEGDNLIIEKTMPESTENKFSPEFEFTESELIAARPSLATGVHYLRPELIARDTAGNIVTEKKDYLAFESAYDVPHVKYNTMIGDIDDGGKITVGVGGSVPVTVFDDDGIASIQYKFVADSAFTSAGSVTGFSSVSVESGLRDKSFDLTAPNVDGPYKLVLKVTDTNSPATVYLRAVDTKVTNGDAATIIIEDPHENSVPSLNVNDFTISGYTIDNQSVSKIAVAWLPAGNSDIAKAEAFFDTYDFSADATPPGTSAQNIKVRKLTASSPVTYESTKKKNTFSVTYDFFNDFKDSAGNVINDAKVFMFACKDTTDNVTIKTFRLNKFTSKPSFSVSYKQDGDTTWTTSTDPLVMCKLKKTDFKITPVTENNMPIENCTVQLPASESTGYDQTQAFVKGTYEYVSFRLSDGSSGAPQSGKQFNLILYAKDKLGGETKNNLTIAFEEVGELESIEADYTTESILTASDTLRLQANFTQRVTVDTKGGTKVPYIQLSGTNFKYKDGTEVAAADRRAYLKSGNESNTLYFEYTIPEDVELEAKDLTIPEDNSITLNGAEVEGIFTGTGVGSEFNLLKLDLDSIAPYIVTYTPSKGGVVESTVDSTTKERSVEIKLTFNEPVEIESGSLVLQRTKDWYIPPVISEDVFLKLFNSPSATSADKINLCGSSTNVFKYGKDENGIDTLIAEGPYMQYTNGLDFSETNAKPDISTKYVLAYQYDIGAKSGKVADIRSTLEKLEYHKAEFDINDMTRSDDGKTLTLKVKDSHFIGNLVNGVEYYLTFDAACVHDAAYNYNTEAIAANEYKFKIDAVATPVIRINRTATNKKESEPSGKVNAKIDCETPDAIIKYQKTFVTTSGKTVTTNTNNSTVHTNAGNVTSATVKGLTASVLVTDKNTGSTVVTDIAGDGTYSTAEKYFIKATASIGSKSADGYEGAFKTVLHYDFVGRNNWSDARCSYNEAGNMGIYGAQTPEGASFTAGWPLTQNSSERKDYQIAYEKKVNPNNNAAYSYYWCSWQLLTDFTLQVHCRGSWQDPADAECTYGQYIYGRNKHSYDWNPEN